MPDLSFETIGPLKIPLVTIMIPTYGQEKLVLNAVDTALAQDYPNLEVIVADDASPDRTYDVVATRKDSRLRYHRNTVNLGRVANYRNTLYNLANGDWVVNLDGDDYYTDTGFIRAAVTLALREPEIFVVMANAMVKGTVIQRQAVTADLEKIVPGVHLLYEIAYRNRWFFHLATLYRRREALLSGFFRMDTLSSDLESICRLSLKGKVAFLNRNVGVWRTTKISASQTHDWKRLLTDLEIWPSVFKEAVALGMPPVCAGVVQRKIIVLCAYSNLSQLIMSGEWTGIMKYMRLFWERYGTSTTALLVTRLRLYIKAIWYCRSRGSN
jgi:glycosyltransferase involved in cell wall biosynthesis